MLKKIMLSAATVALLTGNAIAQETQPKPLDEAAVRILIEKVISERPDLIIQSLDQYKVKQAEEKKQLGLTEVNALLADPSSPRIGDPNATPSGVVFLDYNCVHCRKTHPEIIAWLNADTGRSLVVAELPILGQGSVAAARVALAAQDAKVYQHLSDTLFMQQGQITPENLPQILKSAGFDDAALIKAAQSQSVEDRLIRNMEIAQNLGVTGTPAIVVGDQIQIGDFKKTDIDSLSAKKTGTEG